MIKEHDCIVLTQDISNEGLRAGDVGTVVHIHGDGEAYEAGFVSYNAWIRPVYGAPSRSSFALPSDERGNGDPR